MWPSIKIVLYIGIGVLLTVATLFGVVMYDFLKHGSWIG